MKYKCVIRFTIHKQMIMNKRLSIFAFCLVGVLTFAQNSTNTSGGDATGTGGTVSYSIGQVAFLSAESSQFVISEGVQQVYDIQVITSFTSAPIELDARVYPNPAREVLHLSTSIENLRYELYTLDGQLLSSRKVTDQLESIDLPSVETSSFVLKVFSENKEVKSFKILKN